MNVRPPGSTEQAKTILPASDSRSERRTDLAMENSSSSSRMSRRRSCDTLSVMVLVLMMRPRISITREGRNVLAFETGTPRSRQTCSQSVICATALS